MQAEIERNVRKTAAFCPAVRTVDGFAFTRLRRGLQVAFTARLHTEETVEVSPMSAASDILQELLAAMPDSYQKTIGFPTYDLLAAAALRMEGTDAEIEAAKARLDPENLTGDEFDR